MALFMSTRFVLAGASVCAGGDTASRKAIRWLSGSAERGEREDALGGVAQHVLDAGATGGGAFHPRGFAPAGSCGATPVHPSLMQVRRGPVVAGQVVRRALRVPRRGELTNTAYMSYRDLSWTPPSRRLSPPARPGRICLARTADGHHHHEVPGRPSVLRRFDGRARERAWAGARHGAPACSEPACSSPAPSWGRPGRRPLRHFRPRPVR